MLCPGICTPEYVLWYLCSVPTLENPEEAEMMFVLNVLLCLCSHYPGLCLFPDVSQVS